MTSFRKRVGLAETWVREHLLGLTSFAFCEILKFYRICYRVRASEGCFEDANIEQCIAYSGFCLFFSFHAQRTCFCCTTTRCLWRCTWQVSSLKDAPVRFVPSSSSLRWFSYATVELETACSWWSVVRSRNASISSIWLWAYVRVAYQITIAIDRRWHCDFRPCFFSILFNATGFPTQQARWRVYFHVENSLLFDRVTLRCFITCFSKMYNHLKEFLYRIETCTVERTVLNNDLKTGILATSFTISCTVQFLVQTRLDTLFRVKCAGCRWILHYFNTRDHSKKDY